MFFQIPADGVDVSVRQSALRLADIFEERKALFAVSFAWITPCLRGSDVDKDRSVAYAHDGAPRYHKLILLRKGEHPGRGRDENVGDTSVTDVDPEIAGISVV